jgi:hypothetical protein
VRLGQHLLQDVRNPAVAGGTVVLVLRVQLTKELGDVHAGALRKVLRLVLVLSFIAADVANHQVSQCFEISALELHPSILASRTDKPWHCPCAPSLALPDPVPGEPAVLIRHYGFSRHLRTSGHPPIGDRRAVTCAVSVVLRGLEPVDVRHCGTAH